MDLFDVYILRFDVSEDRAARSLMHVFGLSEASARVFVHSVPRIGKRDVPTQLAERYVRALHAVGAIVECRRSGTAPLGASANRVAQHMSLPAPSDAAVAAATNPPHIQQDSLGIMAPLQYTPDMPQIPKAPRVPADLHHLRARKGPDSMAPNWHPTRPVNASSGRLRPMNSEPSSWDESSDLREHSRDPLSELKDAPDEIQGRGVRGQRRGAARSPQTAREDDDDSDSESEPPRSPSPFAPSHPGQSSGPWYANATHQLLLAALILGGMGLALSAGVFQTSDTQITNALHKAGLDPGTFETATSFVAQAKSSQFAKLSNDQLRGLTELLMSTGAREIWVADIQRVAEGRTSRTLVIELPEDPSVRRAVFDELASAQAGGRNVSDTGQRYVRVDF